MKFFQKLLRKIRKMYDTGALHITVGTFLTKFVAFFGSIVVVRLLTKEEYGILGYVENIYSYALIFAALGMSNAILRYLVIANKDIDRKQYFSYIVKRSIFINIIIALLLLIVSQIMPIPDNFASARLLLPIAALLLPFQDLLNDDLFTIRSFFRNKLYAWAAFSSSAVLILGRIIGAELFGVEGVLWSRVLLNAFFSLIGLYLLWKKFFIHDAVPRLPKEQKKIVDNYSLQYMITNGLWAVFMLNDKFLLGLLLNDPASLADYNVASVLPGNISIFAIAVGTFVGPYFTKNEQNIEWIRRYYKKVASISACLVGVVALFIAVLAKPIILLIYGEQYLNVIPLMCIMLIGAFFNSGLRYTIANLLAAMGKVQYNMIISGIGIVVQILLDIFLIPHLGVMAVAISNCIVFILMSIALHLVFAKLFLIDGHKEGMI